MTAIPNDTLYEATYIDLFCNVTVDKNVDTPIYITRQWPGLTIGPEYNMSDNNDTLRIHQLSKIQDDKRTITCSAAVISSSSEEYVVDSNTVNGSIQLTVNGKPMIVPYVDDFIYQLFYCPALTGDLFTPDVIIAGVPTAGEEFNIACRLDGVVERLAGTHTVSLSFPSPPGGVEGKQSRDGSAYVMRLFFIPVITSDAGTYGCVSKVTVHSSLFQRTSNGVLQIQSNA